MAHLQGFWQPEIGAQKRRARFFPVEALGTREIWTEIIWS